MISCHKQTLPNGLRIVAVEMPHLHSAEIAVYIKAGGRNDPAAKAGLSHFLEHMLFRGTAEFPSNLELETAFEVIGGSVNAATDEESTCYFSRVHPEHVGEGVKLFASMLLRSTLPGIEEINPHNLASRLLWPGHPLGMPTIGYLETIDGFTGDDLRRHLAQYYTPANAVMVVVGDVSAATTFAAAAEAFGAWTGPPPPAALSPSVGQTGPQTVFVEDSDSQVHLQIAFRGFARSAPQIMTSRLMRRILCGGGSSRLHLSLREQMGIVYSVDASIAGYEETGSFAVELSTAAENLVQAVAEVLKETMRLALEPVPAAELLRVKRGYFFDLEYSRDSTYEMQVRYGWGELMDLVRNIEDDRAEAELVDAGTIRSTAAALFAPHNLNLVAVGPLKSSIRKEVEKVLKRYERDFTP
jgi:predicted Zn-dependent peptidase